MDPWATYHRHVMRTGGRVPGEATLADVEAIVARFAERAVVPGFVYGIVADGALVHAGAHGTLRAGEDVPPDVDSVFRIASMTKSFTAAAVLLLRDEGRLRLDDPVGRWVPELAELTGPTADSPPITLEHLLTMSAGLPTDDPWGDRQQGLPFEAFASLLRGGVSFAWTPGTRFEYSNLGYGILGRVITAVAGAEYKDVIRDRLLGPLGMSSTTFERDEVPEARLALGHVKRGDSWVEEPIDPYGALASMGGVFTSVRDLARWVAGFTDAFPPRDDPAGAHPLSRATRREMQQVHRTSEPALAWPSADGPPVLEADHYGYGLFVWDDLRLGRIVGHGGGYPGFGSNMRWHPASGFGVIAFGNARYAPVGKVAQEILAALVMGERGRIRRLAPWPHTTAARAAVERLLERWDDAEAADLFAMNVDLDEPLEARRAEFDRLRDVHGRLRADPDAPVESTTPAHLAWWLRGEHGRVKVEILLDPEIVPRVQALRLTSVPEPPDALVAIARRLADLLAEPGPRLPDDLRLASSVDVSATSRSLRAAEARFGPVILGQAIAGDGERSGTWRLHGDRGDVDLTLELEESGEALRAIGFVPVTLEPPIDAV